ncbi:DUF5412 domain-containing protein [Ureibacillus sinduriensis]|uniref:DUF5412 domain-containing protein n=1 Tax=Ureibacillus sinduriensis BLB-1 = JCM 15800 TaxID=1384057 RepID=A0A0A3IMX1_9BACL|nr:DUF5412 domain-containing protein [Ureibacillus sinduriensis]KGR76187.1 hypothetical protein CD33_08490 [Ureibacillus sinduriensis BLB-1 = JCM 15800]
MTANSTIKGTKRKKIVKISLIISFLFMGVIVYGVYWAFFDMNRLPTGEYLTEETSPDGKYTLKAYVSSPSLSADAVRGEIVFNERNGKTKNIYWNYRESTAKIEWLNNNTVVINGYTLEVPNEKFDFRRQ